MIHISKKGSKNQSSFPNTKKERKVDDEEEEK
jgi:hypothetical protein